jgi:outer membrane lipoprotein SlyB
MKTNYRIATAAVLITAILGGCASQSHVGVPATGSYPAGTQSYPAGTQSYPAPSRSDSSGYGVVHSIETSHTTGSSQTGIGAGTVVGGLVGGILGNQVGGGRGKTAATVAGVVGGAMVGNQMEQRGNAQQMYQVGVRLDNGGYRTLLQDNVAELRVGSRVRIENDRVYRY